MRILTHDQLHRTAPAIFAQEPDAGVSDRYGFVPTINVVDALQAEGWYPVRAQQTNVRAPERQAAQASPWVSSTNQRPGARAPGHHPAHDPLSARSRPPGSGGG
ncbi:hypothetical protein HLV40_13405 [Chromohalobacter salexigens]|nr:hypothetical protein [Chromohalobacter salexigens]